MYVGYQYWHNYTFVSMYVSAKLVVYLCECYYKVWGMCMFLCVYCVINWLKLVDLCETFRPVLFAGNSVFDLHRKTD